MKRLDTVAASLTTEQAINCMITKPVQQSISDNDRELINYLFRELQAAFPAWKQAFPDTDSLNAAKKAWAKGLIENGIISTELIKNGLVKARSSESDFFPSVGKFIAWCTQINGYDPDFAFRHLSTYLAGFRRDIPLEVLAAFDQIGKSALKAKPEIEIRRLFAHTYKMACKEKLSRGTVSALLIEPPVKKVEKQLSPEFKQAQKQRALDRLKIVKKRLFGHV